MTKTYASETCLRERQREGEREGEREREREGERQSEHHWGPASRKHIPRDITPLGDKENGKPPGRKPPAPTRLILIRTVKNNAWCFIDRHPNRTTVDQTGEGMYQYCSKFKQSFYQALHHCPNQQTLYQTPPK